MLENTTVTHAAMRAGLACLSFVILAYMLTCVAIWTVAGVLDWATRRKRSRPRDPSGNGH